MKNQTVSAWNLLHLDLFPEKLNSSCSQTMLELSNTKRGNETLSSSRHVRTSEYLKDEKTVLDDLFDRIRTFERKENIN